MRTMKRLRDHLLMWKNLFIDAYELVVAVIEGHEIEAIEWEPEETPDELVQKFDDIVWIRERHDDTQ